MRSRADSEQRAAVSCALRLLDSSAGSIADLGDLGALHLLIPTHLRSVLGDKSALDASCRN